MSHAITLNSVNDKKISYYEPVSMKKAILIAISTLMALGMIFSYALGAPWLVIVGFFLLTLSPLFPLGKTVDDQRDRILE